MTHPRAGKLGRKPNSGKPRVTLHAGHMPPTYTPPATLDRYSAIPAASIGMDGNDDVGDCTCADVDHEVKSAQVAAGNTEVQSTTAEVLAAYSAITGYNPADPNSDQGAEMQDVRSYWQRTGFTLGAQVHKVMLFAEIAPSNESLLKWALDQFGAVGIGIAFPDSAMDQFNAGQPWDVVAGEPEPTDGHAIAFVGYDDQYLYVATWGVVWRMTWAFYRKYADEAWMVLLRDFVNARSGDDPLGGTMFDLGAQFAALTGQPNPVPAPVPPIPSPSPAPGPSPDASDIALVATLGPWSREHHVGQNERAARAFTTWRIAKGM